MNKLRFSCTRCGNCCTDKNTLVNLTYLDILRIKNGLNLNIREILDTIGYYVYERDLSEEDRLRLVFSPIETEKGLAFVALLKNSMGGCYFYNSEQKKCLIYTLRPILCKTFPFSFYENKKKEKEDNTNLNIFYTKKGNQYCPGIQNQAPFIDYDYWMKLGEETLDILRRNQEIIEEWNDKVKKKEVSPSAKEFIKFILKLNEH
jgi:Fe-S-cluster containining protein